jgi:hypothetical protein
MMDEVIRGTNSKRKMRLDSLLGKEATSHQQNYVNVTNASQTKGVVRRLDFAVGMSGNDCYYCKI